MDDEARFKLDENGESEFSRTFGRWGVAGAPILEVCSLLRAALLAKYPEFFKCENEKLIADIDIAKELSAIEHLEPAEAYEFLIRKIFSAEFERIDREKGEIILNLLDFGCGFGRYLEFYIPLAKVLNELGVKLSVCFNEITSNGLEAIRIRGRKLGFVPDSIDENRFVLGNLSFVTVHTKDPGDLNAAKILITTAMKRPSAWAEDGISSIRNDSDIISDVTLAMFGVASNIYTKEMRRPVLEMLNATSAKILFEAGTLRFLTTEVKGQPFAINEWDNKTGVATYTFLKRTKKYALFGLERNKNELHGLGIPKPPAKKDKLHTNDLGLEAEKAIGRNPLLTSVSFRFTTEIPQATSHSFEDWKRGVYTSLDPETPRQLADCIMVTMHSDNARVHSDKVREIKLHRYHSSGQLIK